MSESTPPRPPERGNQVDFTGDFRETLATVDSRGNRRWVYATIADGFFRRARRGVTVGLMAFYLVMPWLKMQGEQAMLLNIVERKFVFFGSVFIATDTVFLFLMLAISALGLFLATAVIGRVWCGWACPETVFLEFLFRPIERWIEGDALARRKLDSAPWSFSKVRKKLTKHGIYAVLAAVIANTFLSYFVGSDLVLSYITNPPWEHPFAFGVVVFVMGAMAFQFGYFREQFCTIVCPYGRFQSVLLDRDSVVIGYDARRGEPRGKLGTEGAGHCIDCGNCVKVCPTGIDIRNGLQMECINCAACIDACDSVMAKIKRPLGLIRYASHNALEGMAHKILRPRVLIYIALLATLSIGFVYKLSTRELSDFHVVRGALDVPYSTLDSGALSNHLRMHLTNKGRDVALYQIDVVSDSPVKLIVPVNPFPVPANSAVTIPLFFQFERSVLEKGRKKVTLRVSNPAGFVRESPVTLLGPGQ